MNKAVHLIVRNTKRKAWIEYEKKLVKDAPECTCDQPDLKNAIHYLGCPLLNYWVRKFMKFEGTWSVRARSESISGKILTVTLSDKGRYLDVHCECGERGLEANEKIVVNGKSPWHCNHCGRDYAPSQFQSKDK